MKNNSQPVAAIQKFGYTQRIDTADWFCQYCSEPLGREAVTTFGGFAHRACEPIFQIIEHDLEAALDSQARADESSTLKPTGDES